MATSPRFADRMASLAALGFQPVVGTDLEAEVTPVEGGRFKVTCTRPSMGTLVSVTAVHRSRDLVQEAAGRAFEEMDRVVELLNRYEPSSAVSLLNDQGHLHGSPPELDLVLGRALYFHRLSAGAFDPTVQPLVDLLREGEPSEEDLLEAISLVQGGRVEMEPRRIRLGKAGMGVTLDGIAKGFVVDVMDHVLKEHDLQHFLINAGGDIRSEGLREDGEPWRVGVQDPSREGDLPDVIHLSGMAVATSGSYEIYFDPERTRHHLVSSSSGSSPQHHQSVSVTAPTAMEADALATSVFVMKPEEAVTFIDSIPRCACLIIDGAGRSIPSTRWQSATEPPLPKAGTL